MALPNDHKSQLGAGLEAVCIVRNAVVGYAHAQKRRTWSQAFAHALKQRNQGPARTHGLQTYRRHSPSFRNNGPKVARLV